MAELPTVEEIEETFELLDSWEDRYSYIIELGRSLPSIDESKRSEVNLVRGCQSLVWLVVTFNQEQCKLHFELDSDAHIVRGLITMVLAKVQDQSPHEIKESDIEGFFQTLDLISHLSPTRGNGLRAMISRIKHEASLRLD